MADLEALLKPMATPAKASTYTYTMVSRRLATSCWKPSGGSRLYCFVIADLLIHGMCPVCRHPPSSFTPVCPLSRLLTAFLLLLPLQF